VLKFMILHLEELGELINSYNGVVNPDSPKLDTRTLARLNLDLEELLDWNIDSTSEGHSQVVAMVECISAALSRYNINTDDFRFLEVTDDTGTLLLYFGDYTHADLSCVRHRIA